MSTYALVSAHIWDAQRNLMQVRNKILKNENNKAKLDQIEAVESLLRTAADKLYQIKK